LLIEHRQFATLAYGCRKFCAHGENVAARYASFDTSPARAFVISFFERKNFAQTAGLSTLPIYRCKTIGHTSLWVTTLLQRFCSQGEKMLIEILKIGPLRNHPAIKQNLGPSDWTIRDRIRQGRYRGLKNGKRVLVEI
jgi:hypothetical protein